LYRIRGAACQAAGRSSLIGCLPSDWVASGRPAGEAVGEHGMVSVAESKQQPVRIGNRLGWAMAIEEDSTRAGDFAEAVPEGRHRQRHRPRNVAGGELGWRSEVDDEQRLLALQQTCDVVGSYQRDRRLRQPVPSVCARRREERERDR
jgi:hypothetical protein